MNKNHTYLLSLVRQLFDYLIVFEGREDFQYKILVEVEKLYIYISQLKSLKLNDKIVIRALLDSIRRTLMDMKIFDIRFRMIQSFFDQEVYSEIDLKIK